MSQKEFDIIVYGASGYTGQLVAEYLFGQYGTGKLRWAMAGRSQDKLETVRGDKGIAEQVPLIVSDATDADALSALVQRTQVVLTTVGPYQLYGSDLVAACAASGTDYVDLCGEPNWMRQMIDAHESTAQQSGARIVFSCGFDSVPFDLGVYMLQRKALQRFGHCLPRVRGRVRKMQGTFSGGTAASLKATLAAAAKDPQVMDLLRNPLSLAPQSIATAEQPRDNKPFFDEVAGSWVTPFIMAAINTRNVHRSNLLQDYMYGKDFLYDEMVLTGPGDKGEAAARAMAEQNPMSDKNGPKPGEGPSEAEREAGFYDLLFIGTDDDGNRIDVGVTGDKDPGYGSTSKMISECAVCLVEDQLTTTGGVWTVASAMGDTLLHRLEGNAGLAFTVE